MIRIKRIYDKPERNDGFRVLVDRIWPRGVKKEDASINLWLKEVAPSSKLRKWFNHDRDKWEEFCSKYFMELDKKKDEINLLNEKRKSSNLTLVFSARDVEYNNAAALKKYLESL